jgi:acetyltransferase-like isoleucine patch superfamily enzyme
MKTFIKRLITEFIRKTSFFDLISQVQNEKMVARYKNSITNNGATFYPGAEVINLSGDRTKITLGKNTHIRGELLLYNYAKMLHIGDNSYIGQGTIIRVGHEIIIGDDVLIAHNVTIIDSDSHEIDYIERRESFKKMLLFGHPKEKGNVNIAPIHIEDSVWISYNCCILKGVTIGKGAIVAAGSVVTKDVQPFTLVGGNPARAIKKING